MVGVRTRVQSNAKHHSAGNGKLHSTQPCPPEYLALAVDLALPSVAIRPPEPIYDPGEKELITRSDGACAARPSGAYAGGIPPACRAPRCSRSACSRPDGSPPVLPASWR
jgi:hypothetical protein